MKTFFLTLFVLLFNICSYSQDKARHEFDALDSISLVQKTKDLLKLQSKYEYTDGKWIESGSDSFIRIVYLRKDLQDDKIEQYYDECKNCITFSIERYFIEGNEALEKDKQEVYTINAVKGGYLDLFRIWKRRFRSDAENLACYNDYKYRSSYNDKREKIAWFSGDDGKWEIHIF